MDQPLTPTQVLTGVALRMLAEVGSRESYGAKVHTQKHTEVGGECWSWG